MPSQPQPATAPAELFPVHVVPPVARIPLDVGQVAACAKAVSPQQSPTATHVTSQANLELLPVPVEVPPVAKTVALSANPVPPQQAPFATEPLCPLQVEVRAECLSTLKLLPATQPSTALHPKTASSQQAPTALPQLTLAPNHVPPSAKIPCDVEQVAASSQAVSFQQPPVATQPTARAEWCLLLLQVPRSCLLSRPLSHRSCSPQQSQQQSPFLLLWRCLLPRFRVTLQMPRLCVLSKPPSQRSRSTQQSQ